MTEWTWIAFGDLYMVPSKNGLMAPSRVRGSGPLLVNMREIFAFDRISHQEMDRAPLPERNSESWLLQADDLLFARQSLTLAGAGKVSLVLASPNPMTFESHIIRVRLDPSKADARFYYYLFRSTVGRALIESIVEQVAAAGIRASDLGKLQVPYPDLHEQRRIASVLDALDALIDTNRALTSSMESQISALFAHYGFDDAPTGEALRLDALVEVGPKLPKPTGEAPYVNMAALPTDSSRISSVARRAPSGGARFQNRDTLLARLTPCLENGKAAFVDVLGEEEIAVGSTEFIVLRDRGDVGAHWPYVLTRSPRFRDYAILHMNGSSGRQRVSADSIARYPMARPTTASLARFRGPAEAAFRAIAMLSEETEALVRARDEILLLLMSGKIRVTDVEAA